MKCPSYSDDCTALCHMEKAKSDLVEMKRHTVSTRKTSAPSSPVKAIISTPVEARSKGPHNKENYQNKRDSLEVASDDEVIISGCGLPEDSGYLSLQNSRLDHGDVGGVDSLERSKVENVSSQSLDAECHSAPCLPVLNFQEEVCRELVKSYKKSRSYDWTVVNKVAVNFGLHNVIGGKMGLQFVDILCDLLKKDMRHILARVLGLLGDCDLVR